MTARKKAVPVKPVTLSDDAKAVAGAWFGFGNMGSSLTLHLRESKPTARTQAALDELVKAGCLSVEPFNRYGGVIYRPLRDLREYGSWLMRNRGNGKFKLLEPATAIEKQASQPQRAKHDRGTA